jgi:hypothetical protein
MGSGSKKYLHGQKIQKTFVKAPLPFQKKGQPTQRRVAQYANGWTTVANNSFGF